nr:immunoglobulin light chain junction region [Macaca mulatta]MOV82228.1 immunoglobulin light chain junction region [Macaca mulatta]MOV85326.1 immunoglobulin light chain junction region [Macaca mulatta]
CGQGTHLPPTF